MARPLYTAPEAELSTAITAPCKLTAGFQPRIVPSSVTNRKNEGPDLELADTANWPVPLNTRPVGVPPVARRPEKPDHGRCKGSRRQRCCRRPKRVTWH